jgi:signal transduction histidine kinase
VSTQGGWNHVANNIITQYKAGENSSGLIDEWIQSKLFSDKDGNLYSTTFEYLTILNKNQKAFQSKQIKFNGNLLRSNYQIIELDTNSNKLLMTADSLLLYYDYTKHAVISILDNKLEGKIFYKKNNFIIGCLSANGSGLDVYIKNKKWTKLHLLDKLNGNKLIVLNGVILNHSAYLNTNLGILELNLHNFKYSFILPSSSYRDIKDITTNNSDEVYFLDENGTHYNYNVDKKSLEETSLKKYKYSNLDFKQVFEMKYINPNMFYISTKHYGYHIIDITPLIECQQTKITENKQGANLHDKFFKNTFERNQNLYEIEGNLVYLHHKTKQTKKQIFQSNAKIYRYCQNSKGEYLSSENGLINFQDFKIVKNNLPNNKIALFAFTTKGIDYIITTDGYLMKFDSVYPNTYISKIGFGYHIHHDSTILISTSKSLLLINGEQFTDITTHSSCYGAAIDQSGMIWYINDDGLHHFDINTCIDTRIINDTTFPLDKLPPLHQNNRIVFSCKNELYSIKTSCIKAFQNDPKLYMKESRIDNIISDSEDFNQIKDNYQLLDFTFKLFETHSDSTQNLKYKINGLNDIWTNANINQPISIPRLATGAYKLEVIGIGSNGYQSNSIIIPFTILPPFYQRAWFIVLSALSFILLGFMINYNRNNKKIKAQQIELDKLKALQEQRERLARDLHDEIGSGLSKIKFISGLQPEKDKLQEDIQQLSSTLLGNMRDMLWSLDAENDHLQDMVTKIRTSTNTQLKLTGIQLNMEISELQDDVEITGFVRRNLLMMVKEAVHNVIKHSNATTIWIKIDVNQNQLQIAIKDNGQEGNCNEINHDQTGKYGLASMRKRALDIGATLHIQNLKTGWSIVIVYPLKSI